MAATRRLKKEIDMVRSEEMQKIFQITDIDEANFAKWEGIILPGSPPYDKGAFKIEINFPAEYPFKPPKIVFKTKMYHPNVDEKGNFCLSLITPDNWKPATKTDQVIQSIVALIGEPEIDHPLSAEIAEEYTKDKKKFLKNAEEYTKKYAEPRPD